MNIDSFNLSKVCFYCKFTLNSSHDCEEFSFFKGKVLCVGKHKTMNFSFVLAETFHHSISFNGEMIINSYHYPLFPFKEIDFTNPKFIDKIEIYKVFL